jgi:hypothetical protein
MFLKQKLGVIGEAGLFTIIGNDTTIKLSHFPPMNYLDKLLKVRRLFLRVVVSIFLLLLCAAYFKVQNIDMASVFGDL